MGEEILRVGCHEGRWRGKTTRATGPSGRAGNGLESGKRGHARASACSAGANKHISEEKAGAKVGTMWMWIPGQSREHMSLQREGAFVCCTCRR